MSEKTPCRRCGREIDTWARLCPFCNWNQAQEAPAPRPVETAAAASAPAHNLSEEKRALKKQGMMILGGVLLLIASFGIGMLINRDGAPKAAPETLEEQAAKQNPISAPKRADTPLVPAGAGGIQQPITSAPAVAPDGSVPNEYHRTDATAVSALEYAQMERRALAEKKQTNSLVDPRSLTGPAYAQAPPLPVRRIPPATRPSAPLPGSSAPESAQEPVRVARTRPVPQEQPIPPIRAHGSAKLALTVGPDGRVTDIDVQRALPGGHTAALLAAVQRWRFKPATENGRPVSSPYTVEIRFK